MKFGKHLLEAGTPEWRTQFIDYKLLKKKLKPVKRKRAQLSREKELVEQSSVPASTPPFQQQQELVEQSELAITIENRIIKQVSPAMIDTMLYREESNDFFTLLVSELDKINKFYMKTEKECIIRHTRLTRQLQIYHYNFKKKNILSKLGRHSTSKQMILLGFQEHYRALVLLQNYRVLNYTGFTKIMKKFIKCSDNAPEFREEVLSVIQDEPFYSSPILSSLLEQVEDAATQLHSGNRKQAMHSLRIPGKGFDDVENQALSFRCGLWLGSSIIITIVTAYSYMTQYTTLPKIPQYSEFSFFMFRVLLFPILLLNFIAINLRIWDAARINYVFIFELDPRRHMNKNKFLELSLILYLMWICFVQFYIWTVVNDVAGHIHFNKSPWSYPLIMMGAIAIVLLFPHPRWVFGGARLWLLKRVFNCVIAPFATVRFADFWFADQLTSMSEFLFEVQFVFCILPTDFKSPLKTFCDQTQSMGVPLLNAWPNFSRLMQCFRRYRDAPNRDHLVNAGKYGSTLFVMLYSFLQKSVLNVYFPKLSNATLIIYLVSNVLSTMYKYYWDIVKDWGLFRFGKDVKYKGLRKDILFNPLLYYISMLINLGLRFMWVVVFSLRATQKVKLDVQWFLFLVAFAEIFRRSLWNVFRLENEHLNNCGNFRAVLEIPLPFDQPEEQEAELQAASKTKKKPTNTWRNAFGLFKVRQPEEQSTLEINTEELPHMPADPPKPRETFVPRSRTVSMSLDIPMHIRKSPSMPAIAQKKSISFGVNEA